MPRVLIIDDAALFRALETSSLRRGGCHLVVASDADGALDKARALPPDLILIDADRAGLDVPALLGRLRDDPALRSVPVLAVASEERADACRRSGVDRVLSRSPAPGDLEIALADLAGIGRRSGLRRTAGVRASARSAGTHVHGRVRDISGTGMFLSTSDLLPLEARVDLTLTLPDPQGPRSVRARGVVVRRVPEERDSHRVPGVAVRFIDLAPAVRETIEEYVVGRAGPAPEDRDRS